MHLPLALTGWRGVLLAESAPSNPREIAARVFLCIAIVVVVGRIVGALFRRLGQPAVLGEILAGIALGPSLLGVIGKDLPAKLFPLEVRPFLRVVSELGLVVFMFIVGLEVDPAVIRRSGRKAVVISVTSVVVPFALGVFGLSAYLYGGHRTVIADGETIAVKRLGFSLFIGVSMCVTAFPILARILTERRMFRIPLGMLLISAAAADDIIAFALLTVTLSVAGSAHGLPILVVLLLLVVFLAVLFLVVRPLVDRFVMEPYRASGRLRPDHLAILLGCVVACAYASFKIMDSSLIGPFLFGAALPRRSAGHFFETVIERVEGISVTLLLPVFFVVTGLGVDVKGLGAKGIVPLLVIIATACIGKFAGAGIAARLQGVSPRQSLAIGTMMNTRGLAELVILGIARDRHILDGQLYTMLVIMAVVTTVMAGPLLKVVYPDRWLEHDIAEAERARAGLARGIRTVVFVADPAASTRVVDLAIAATGTTRPAEIALVHLPRSAAPTDVASGLTGGLAALTASFSVLAEQRRRIEALGITCATTSRLSADPTADLSAQVHAANPDLVLVEWSEAAADAARPLMGDPPALVAVVSGPVAPLQAFAVQAGSGVDADAALELAARLTRGSGAALLLTDERSGRSRARSLRELEAVGITAQEAAVSSLVENVLRPGGDERWSVIAADFGEAAAGDDHGAAADWARLAAAAQRPCVIVAGPERDHAPLTTRLGLDDQPPVPTAHH